MEFHVEESRDDGVAHFPFHYDLVSYMYLKQFTEVIAAAHLKIAGR